VNHFLTLLVLSLSFQVVASSSNYYNPQELFEFTQGSMEERDLLYYAGKVSKKSFHPLGYKRGSKKAIFGRVDLKQDNRGYFIQDVYCNLLVRNRVGPTKIPANNEMNVEHTWPQSKGAKREPLRGDIHHLFPTNSRANSTRGNHIFGEIDNGENVATNCLDSVKGKVLDPATGERTRIHGFQPPVEHRGNVARAIFYVSAGYRYQISSLEEYYLRKWHKDDPVDQQEQDRNDAIEKAQGNRNPFIDFPEIVNRITDF